MSEQTPIILAYGDQGGKAVPVAVGGAEAIRAMLDQLQPGQRREVPATLTPTTNGWARPVTVQLTREDDRPAEAWAGWLDEEGRWNQARVFFPDDEGVTLPPPAPPAPTNRTLRADLAQQIRVDRMVGMDEGETAAWIVWSFVERVVLPALDDPLRGEMRRRVEESLRSGNDPGA